MRFETWYEESESSCGIGWLSVAKAAWKHQQAKIDELEAANKLSCVAMARASDTVIKQSEKIDELEAEVKYWEDLNNERG